MLTSLLQIFTKWNILSCINFYPNVHSRSVKIRVNQQVFQLISFKTGFCCDRWKCSDPYHQLAHAPPWRSSGSCLRTHFWYTQCYFSCWPLNIYRLRLSSLLEKGSSKRSELCACLFMPSLSHLFIYGWRFFIQSLYILRIFLWNCNYIFFLYLKENILINKLSISGIVGYESHRGIERKYRARKVAGTKDISN